MPSGKRKNGERKPSARLNILVNGYPIGLFREITRSFELFDDLPAFKKIILWNRGKVPYDSDKEKAAFSSYDVNSLRKTAIAFLQNYFALEIESLRNEAQALKGKRIKSLVVRLQNRADFLLQWQYYPESVSVLKILYQLLLEDEEFRRDNILLEEISAKIVKVNYYSNISTEEIPKWDNLKDQIRGKFYESGEIIEEITKRYLDSEFFKIKASSLPACLASEKLSLDEFFVFITGNRKEALKMSLMNLELFKVHKSLSPVQLSKLLRRIADHSAEVNDRKGIHLALNHFEQLSPLSSENFQIFSKKYLTTLFLVCFDSKITRFGDKALRLFEENESVFLSEEDTTEKLVLLLCVAAYYISIQKAFNANKIFDQAYKIKTQKVPLQYRLQYMIFHLIILFEIKDQLRFRSFARNYIRHFKSNQPFAEPVLKLAIFLSKNLKRKIDNDKNLVVSSIIDELAKFSGDSRFRKSLWYSPIIKWLKNFES